MQEDGSLLRDVGLGELHQASRRESGGPDEGQGNGCSEWAQHAHTAGTSHESVCGHAWPPFRACLSLRCYRGRVHGWAWVWLCALAWSCFSACVPAQRWGVGRGEMRIYGTCAHASRCTSTRVRFQSEYAQHAHTLGTSHESVCGHAGPPFRACLPLRCYRGREHGRVWDWLCALAWLCFCTCVAALRCVGDQGRMRSCVTFVHASGGILTQLQSYNWRVEPYGKCTASLINGKNGVCAQLVHSLWNCGFAECRAYMAFGKHVESCSTFGIATLLTGSRSNEMSQRRISLRLDPSLSAMVAHSAAFGAGCRAPVQARGPCAFIAFVVGAYGT